MNTRNVALILASFVALSGCSTLGTAKIAQIRSLGSSGSGGHSNNNSGDIAGLERISTSSAGKIDANILIVHGMGWSQKAVSGGGFGTNLIKAVQLAYGPSATVVQTPRLCPLSGETEATTTGALPGGIKISSDSLPITTDAPLTRLGARITSCLDRITINLGSRGRIKVYRFFWDNSFYDAYEYPHLGYDDDIFSKHEITTAKHHGYENISALRAQYTSRIKNKFVTYGFSDATMYLGLVGQQIRQAVRGAICATVNEVTGQTRLFDRIEDLHRSAIENKKFLGEEVASEQLCQTKGTITAAPLTIISESLGSRIMFDVLTADRTKLLAEKLNSISNTELEVFMFANQIPLLGLGRMRQPKAPAPPMEKKLKFIAVSEINDILTYELVPYFEHLFYIRCSWGTVDAEADCSVKDPAGRMVDMRANPLVRKRYVDELGFDVVDVRAVFAGNIFPFLPLAHPLSAHNGHFNAKPLRDLLICGADAGSPRLTGCSIQ